MNNITSQSRDVYKVISRYQPLTAAEVARRLRILPNAAYRPLRVLTQFGFISRQDSHPARYVSSEPLKAIDLYLIEMRNNLKKHFLQEIKVDPKQNAMSVSFIESRKKLFEMTDEDMDNVENKADFIVSGLEVPAETMLVNKTARDRGVAIRIIVQNQAELMGNSLQTYKKMGVKVRFYPLIEARMIVFDSRIAYITSYNPNQKQEGFGVRFDYKPIARIFQELFDRRWSEAKAI